jgi:hypothetical protein
MSCERGTVYCHNATEQQVLDLALEAGFTVTNAETIRIESPVPDKKDCRKKTVTVPDFHIIDPHTGNVAIVEVTKGSGDTPHKLAQKRVVEEAHISNYYVLTGDKINAIAECPTGEGKYQVFCQLFAWSIE